MVTQKKRPSADKKAKAKVSGLKLNKETVKDLSDSEAGMIKGGAKATAANCSNPCPATKLLCPRATTVPAGCNPTVVQSSGCPKNLG